MTCVSPRGNALRLEKVAGFRDVLVHDYVDIEIDHLYFTMKNDLPVLRGQIVSVLADFRKE